MEKLNDGILEQRVKEIQDTGQFIMVGSYNLENVGHFDGSNGWIVEKYLKDQWNCHVHFTGVSDTLNLPMAEYCAVFEFPGHWDMRDHLELIRRWRRDTNPEYGRIQKGQLEHAVLIDIDQFVQNKKKMLFNREAFIPCIKRLQLANLDCDLLRDTVDFVDSRTGTGRDIVGGFFSDQRQPGYHITSSPSALY